MDRDVHVACVDRQLCCHRPINLKLNFVSRHFRVGLLGQLEELVEAVLSEPLNSRQSLLNLALHVQDLVADQLEEAALVLVVVVPTHRIREVVLVGVVRVEGLHERYWLEHGDRLQGHPRLERWNQRLLRLHLEWKHLPLVPRVVVWEMLRVMTHLLPLIEASIAAELRWHELLLWRHLELLEFIRVAVLLMSVLGRRWHLWLLLSELGRYSVEWHRLVVECLGVHHLWWWRSLLRESCCGSGRRLNCLFVCLSFDESGCSGL